jgi:type I restriction enzyme S subunit
MSYSLGARHTFLRKHGVPDGWQARVLGDLARVVGGATPKREESRFWAGGRIPWATPTDLTANRSKYITETAECITDSGLASCAASLLPAGSVLYTSRATIGAKALSTVPMATNQGFASFIPDNVDPEYLYYLLELLTPIIKRLAAGTTFDEVSKRDVRSVYCAVPSDADEQAAIVRILRLVEAAVVTSFALLERSKSVKRALIQQLLARGLRGERQKKSAIGAVPMSWDVVPLGTVVRNFQYGLSVPMEEAGRLPILRMGNIQDGKIVFDGLKYLNAIGNRVSEYMLRRGDVLFNRTNSQEWVGKVGVYRDDRECVFASYIIRILPDPMAVDNYFLGHVLGSYLAQCRIKRYATPGVQQVNINATNLAKVLIPVPRGRAGLEEQREITALLEAAESTVESYQRLATDQLHLRKSIITDLLSGKVRVKTCR